MFVRLWKHDIGRKWGIFQVRRRVVWPHEIAFFEHSKFLVACCAVCAIFVIVSPGLSLLERAGLVLFVPAGLAMGYFFIRVVLRAFDALARPFALFYAFCVFYGAFIGTIMMVLLFPSWYFDA